MKTIYKLTLLILVLSISFINSTNAQSFDDICATDNGDIHNLENVYTYSNDANYLASMEPVVLNVYYWRIDAPDGSVHPWALTEQRALESIAYLNANFNQIGVFFKYRGMGHFSSPPDVVHKIRVEDLEECITILGGDPDGFETLSRCQRGALMTFVYQNDYIEPNAINLYVPRGLTDFGGSAQGPTKSITHPGGLISNTVIHELCHNFSLDHTFKGWFSPDNPDLCEHVERNPASDDFNALSRGDFLAGTAAAPDFGREYCELNDLPDGDCVGANAQYGYFYYDEFECKYIGNDFRLSSNYISK